MQEKKTYEKPKIDVLELKYRSSNLLNESCGEGECPDDIDVGT